MGSMNPEGVIYDNFRRKFAPPKEGDLEVWWIPQLPMTMEGFRWRVASLERAAVLLDVLAAYDDFQFANRVKGDYANAGGLEVFRSGEWEEWESEDCLDFDEYRDNRASLSTSTLSAAKGQE